MIGDASGYSMRPSLRGDEMDPTRTLAAAETGIRQGRLAADLLSDFWVA